MTTTSTTGGSYVYTCGMRQIQTLKLIRHHSGDVPEGSVLNVVSQGVEAWYCEHPDNKNMSVSVLFKDAKQPNFKGPSGLSARDFGHDK